MSNNRTTKNHNDSILRLMKKKILIVEDDHLISTIFRMFLKELGYDLLEIVEDGQEAIHLCEKLKPDIVLMDVHLDGDLDGIQTTEIIKSKFDIPVIFLSSDTEESTIQRVINTHSYGYLVKPIDKKELGISIELAFYKHQYDVEQKNREAKFRNFITDSPEAIVLVNELGKVEYLNCLALKLFRTPYLEDILGTSFLSYIAEEYQTVFKKELENSLEEEKGISYTHFKMKTVHNQQIDVGLTGAQIEFNNKKNIQLILRDISQDFAYREELIEKKEIINKLNDCVMTFDLNGKIRTWNKACENIFDLKETEMVGKSYLDLNLLPNQKNFTDDLFAPSQDINGLSLDTQIGKNKVEAQLKTSILENGTKPIGLLCQIKTKK